MSAQLAVIMSLPVAGALVAWLCSRGYYRAAYGDRYQRGYGDGREAQIRVYQSSRVSLAAWREQAMPSAPPLPPPACDAYGDEEAVRVLGSWYPEAAGPPRYAQLSPDQLDDGPPTSEWARGLIAGIKQWGAEYQQSGGPPWRG